MNHWGKIIGGFGGYLVGGLIGFVIGLMLGILVDKFIKTTKPFSFTQISPQALVRIRKEFFTTTFSTLGHLYRNSGKSENNSNGYAGHVLNRMKLPEEKWREECACLHYACGPVRAGRRSYSRLQARYGRCDRHDSAQ